MSNLATSPAPRPWNFTAMILVAGIALAQGPASGPAHANWLTKILREAGEQGRNGAARGLKHLDGDLGDAVRHLEGLSEKPGSVALAAEAGPEGHWRFVTRQGETFTAATPDELSRMREVLAPGHSGPLDLYLTADSVFAQRALLDELPPGARLHVVIARRSYPITSEGNGATKTLFAEVRPGLRISLDDEALVTDALFQLARPIQPRSLRVVALEAGGADSLPRVPQFDATTKQAPIDRVEPTSLAQAMRSLSGQTIILTGRIEGTTLKFQPSRGGEGRLDLQTLKEAARAADVDLVIVRSNTPRQPGGRNWLWQTTSVPGLDAALREATFGDFLAALSAKTGPMTVRARPSGAGYIALDATPASGSAVPLGEALGDWVDLVSSEVLGNIALSGIEADLTDQERKRELDLRFLPGIPALIQWGYLSALVASLFGPVTAWRWWSRIWPPEDRAEYGGALGYALARGVRMLLFVLIFLPLAGPVLFVRFLALQLWGILMAPIRFLRWLGGLVFPRTA